MPDSCHCRQGFEAPHLAGGGSPPIPLDKKRSRARIYSAWPFVALPTLLVAAVAGWLIESILAGPMHLRLADAPDAVLTFSPLIGIGFIGGLYWARCGARRGRAAPPGCSGL